MHGRSISRWVGRLGGRVVGRADGSVDVIGRVGCVHGRVSIRHAPELTLMSFVLPASRIPLVQLGMSAAQFIQAYQPCVIDCTYEEGEGGGEEDAAEGSNT